VPAAPTAASGGTMGLNSSRITMSWKSFTTSSAARCASGESSSDSTVTSMTPSSTMRSNATPTSAPT
jgi:hypothetical protein